MNPVVFSSIANECLREAFKRGYAHMSHPIDSPMKVLKLRVARRWAADAAYEFDQAHMRLYAGLRVRHRFQIAA